MARQPHPERDEAPDAPVTGTDPARAARAAVGVHGDDKVPSWSQATTSASRARVLGLSLVAGAETAGVVALAFLLPVVAATEGWNVTGTNASLLIAGTVAALSGLLASDRFAPERRVWLLRLLAVNGAVVTVLLGLVPVLPVMIVLLLVRGLLAGMLMPSLRTLTFDAVVPEARARATSRVVAGGLLGAAVGALCAAASFGGPELDPGTGVALAGAVGLLAALAGTLRLTDPGQGGVEQERLARTFGGDRRLEALSEPMRMVVPRVLAVHTVRTALSAYVTAGALSFALVFPWRTAVGSANAQSDDPVTASTLLVVLAVVLVVTAVVVALVSRGVEKNSRRSLTRLMRSAWLEPVVLGGVAALVLAFVESSAVALTVALALGLVGGAITWVALDTGVLATVPRNDRTVVATLAMFSWVSGAVLAALVVPLQADEFPRTGYVLLAVLLAISTVVNHRIVRQADADLDATLPIDPEQIIAETPPEPETGLVAEVSPYAYVAPPAEVLDAEGRPPLLSVEGVSFAYGSVQVLFDVDLTVKPGEIVALLGPNGVGKTTLLRCLSGLEIPQQGVVRFDGTDVTRMSASRRVPLGLSQIVGGNAVFGTLSVAENLQMYGYSVTRDRKAVAEGIERAYSVFPRLADRRNQLGSTLSGGEQQMLGLSKALITKPKLLVIDEFSLGLAPVIVAELLSMVRELNANGTAVLVVEQSVNVALNLVDRCYFMEKGRIIHEDTAEALRAQPELVQALSLGGLPPELAETTA